MKQTFCSVIVRRKIQPARQFHMKIRNEFSVLKFSKLRKNIGLIYHALRELLEVPSVISLYLVIIVITQYLLHSAQVLSKLFSFHCAIFCYAHCHQIYVLCESNLLESVKLLPIRGRPFHCHYS